MRCSVALLFPESANITLPIRTPSFPSTSVEMFSSSITDNPTNAGSAFKWASDARVSTPRASSGAGMAKAVGDEISAQSKAANKVRGENMNHPQQAGKEEEANPRRHHTLL